MGQDQFILTSTLAVTSKSPGTCRLRRDTHTQAHVFKNNITEISHSFIETEKVKQSEKTKEYVTWKRKYQTTGGKKTNNIEIKSKAIIIKMPTGLRKRIEEHSENINKELKNI